MMWMSRSTAVLPVKKEVDMGSQFGGFKRRKLTSVVGYVRLELERLLRLFLWVDVHDGERKETKRALTCYPTLDA